MHNTPAAVTAASTAFPPCRRTSTAASVASGDEVAAAPFRAWIVERPGSWKLRIGFSVALACGDSKVARRSVKFRDIGFALISSRFPQKRRRQEAAECDCR
jgi:hypothetical protein